jgi:transposase
MRGAKLRLNEELIKEISQHVRDGSFYKDAALLVGVTEHTFHDWKKKGITDLEENKQTIYSQFIQSLRQAEAEAKAEAVKYIQRSEDWKARAWYLERKYNDEFGNKQKIEHSGDDEKPVVVKLKWD